MFRLPSLTLCLLHSLAEGITPKLHVVCVLGNFSRVFASLSINIWSFRLVVVGYCETLEHYFFSVKLHNSELCACRCSLASFAVRVQFPIILQLMDLVIVSLSMGGMATEPSDWNLKKWIFLLGVCFGRSNIFLFSSVVDINSKLSWFGIFRWHLDWSFIRLPKWEALFGCWLQ